jgi:hypothetical protein
MSRRGRKRRKGLRRPNGRLVHERGESPREIAARMPHRRALGENALDYRAESALGRLAIAGRITDEQFVAGTAFRRSWGVYLSTIMPPRAIGVPSGAFWGCEGCPQTQDRAKCVCARRRAFYEDANRALHKAGNAAVAIVKLIVLHDWPIGNSVPLHLGLDALALHFGLTRANEQGSNNRRSQSTRPPGDRAGVLS